MAIKCVYSTGNICTGKECSVVDNTSPDVASYQGRGYYALVFENYYMDTVLL